MLLSDGQDHNRKYPEDPDTTACYLHADVFRSNQQASYDAVIAASNPVGPGADDGHIVSPAFLQEA